MNLPSYKLAQLVLLTAICGSSWPCSGQGTQPQSLEHQVQQLNEAVARTAAQLEQSQRDLAEMRAQLAALQLQLAATIPATPANDAKSSDSSEQVAERTEMQQSEIATLEQTKVETVSKFPFKVTGLLLINGFVNTAGVDFAATPTIAEAGSGTTGLSVRQTIVGFSAQGPHLAGASSYADLNIDFSGTPASSANNYSGSYSGHPSALRLRTMHAGLRWKDSKVEFSFDRPILSPDYPSTLTALAEPEFAWSGNLWQWNPQISVSHEVSVGHQTRLQMQAAWIDPQDAILPPVSTSQYITHSIYSSLAEQSRLPGLEGRIALLEKGSADRQSHFGVGGYVSQHAAPDGNHFTAWAATLDTQLQLPLGMEFTGSSYRGAALGGLGAGTYKDFVYKSNPTTSYIYDYTPLDDVGGWVQLKKRAGQKLELNAAFGIDNAFAHELREYSVANPTVYQALARNHTAMANVIYSPRAYLLFSTEYRHIMSTPYSGPTQDSNIVGVSAGYKF